MPPSAAVARTNLSASLFVRRSDNSSAPSNRGPKISGTVEKNIFAADPAAPYEPFVVGSRGVKPRLNEPVMMPLGARRLC
jgi:hypothetical protein